MIADRRVFLLALGAALAGCGAGGNGARMPMPADRGRGAAGLAGAGRVEQAGPAGFPDIPFADWTDAEPEYVLYPGDEIEVATPTATELTRQLRVGPDGRIALPLVGQLMAADRTLAELELAASQSYASQLVRPVVEVTLRQAGPIQVYVGGEVRTPGVYAMSGDIDAYQAVVMAGDFLPTAKAQECALIRRGPGGRRMLRVVDLRPRRGQVVAVRRGDIIFAPRTGLGELANFFTLVRNALPMGFSYAVNGVYASF